MASRGRRNGRSRLRASSSPLARHLARPGPMQRWALDASTNQNAQPLLCLGARLERRRPEATWRPEGIDTRKSRRKAGRKVAPMSPVARDADYGALPPGHDRLRVTEIRPLVAGRRTDLPPTPSFSGVRVGSAGGPKALMQEGTTEVPRQSGSASRSDEPGHALSWLRRPPPATWA